MRQYPPPPPSSGLPPLPPFTAPDYAPAPPLSPPVAATQATTPRTGAAQAPHRASMLRASFASALEALWANRLRSLLTTLGIIVGVAAVITVVTLTQGAAALITSGLGGLGTNVLLISPGTASLAGVRQAVGTEQTLTQADADALSAVPHVVAASPVVSANAQVVFGNQNWNTRVEGVYANFQSIGNWQLSEGAWFSEEDDRGSLPVAVLGQTVRQNVFGATSTDPLNQTVLIRGQAFRVVGVLQSKGASSFLNQDDVVFIPFNTAAARLNNSGFVNLIEAQADDASTVNAAVQGVTDVLAQRHRIAPGAANDFTVRSSAQLVATAQQVTQTLTLLLAGIAAISLLVGGIGIMNIMLVSVTERTREIGIRMAVGARRRDIRNQFLIEALTLSAGGGVLGILLGLAGGLGLTLAFGLPFTLNVVALLIAVGVSAAIGVGFGLYPAVRASKLDPIVALRTE